MFSRADDLGYEAGMSIWQSAPIVCAESKQMLPRLASIASFAIASPKPAPSADDARDVLLRKKRSNTRFWSVAGIPGPWSRIDRRRNLCASRSTNRYEHTIVELAGENLTALCRT